MRERQFVDQNRGKWERFEAFTEGRSTPQPGELSALYTQITDDLSYARTYYGRRSIRIYLNNLAQRAFLSLHKNRDSRARPLLHFWTADLPLALYRSRKELSISLVFFLFSMAIGVLSSVYDPDFAEVILGRDYIEMTENNIRSGDPMGVYKRSSEWDMFLAISVNNLLVAFRTFVLGAFFGVGTLVIMLYNGIMVGSFQYFFVERSLFTESFLTIWMHGALEISAIVIAGGAGLTLGRGLLFPGNLPRLQSFQLAARRSLKIMLGLFPIFLAAAFIEGFFTRITELNDFVRASFIFFCFAFVALYFWWYPKALFGRSDADRIRKEELIDPLNVQLKLSAIRKHKEVFTGAFALFRRHFSTLLGWALLFSLLYVLAFWLLYGAEGLEQLRFDSILLYDLHQLHDYGRYFWNFFLNTFFISAILFTALRHFAKQLGGSAEGLDPPPWKVAVPDWRSFVKIALLVSIFELFILSENDLVATLGVVFIPFFLLYIAVATLEQRKLPDAFGRMLFLLNGSRRRPFMIFISLGLVSGLMLLLIDSPFTWFYVDVLQWNLNASDEGKVNVLLLTILFLGNAGLALALPLLLYGQVLEYYSAREVKEAAELSAEIESIGKQDRAYGLEME